MDSAHTSPTSQARCCGCRVVAVLLVIAVVVGVVTVAFCTAVAAYSHQYAHKVEGTSSLQLVVARVAVGSVETHREPVRMLRRPGDSCHSVCGRVPLSRTDPRPCAAHIVYSNDQAYPAYIVTYAAAPSVANVAVCECAHVGCSGGCGCVCVCGK